MTIDSYDDVEICKLVGIYTLFKVGNITSKTDTGYGLIILRDLNWEETEKMRKKIIKVFIS